MPCGWFRSRAHAYPSPPTHEGAGRPEATIGRRERERSPPGQRRAGPDRTRSHRRRGCEDRRRGSGRRPRIEGRRRCKTASLRDPYDQTAAFGLPAERRPQRSKNRSDRDVRTIELLWERLFQAHANAPRAALDDQCVAFVPDAVGQSRQQRGDRCQNTSIRHIRAYVACERAAIDQNRYRNRWE